MVLWYRAYSLVGNPREGPPSFASSPLLLEDPLWSLRSLFSRLVDVLSLPQLLSDIRTDTPASPSYLPQPSTLTFRIVQPAWHVNLSSLRKMKERQDSSATLPVLAAYLPLHQPWLVLCDHQERPFFCWRFSGTLWMGHCGVLSEP